MDGWWMGGGGGGTNKFPCGTSTTNSASSMAGLSLAEAGYWLRLLIQSYRKPQHNLKAACRSPRCSTRNSIGFTNACMYAICRVTCERKNNKNEKRDVSKIEFDFISVMNVWHFLVFFRTQLVGCVSCASCVGLLYKCMFMYIYSLLSWVVHSFLSRLMCWEHTVARGVW